MAARKGSGKATSTRDAINAVQDVLRAKHKGSSDMEELVKLALDILNTDYWDDVRGVTADLLQQVKDGEIKNEEELNERLHEAIDGTQRVIYTFQARLGLISTNNADAYEDEMGEKPEGPEQAMFMAMERDVRAQLDAEDVDSLFKDDEDG